jgi:hypothetical protein
LIAWFADVTIQAEMKTNAASKPVSRQVQCAVQPGGLFRLHDDIAPTFFLFIYQSPFQWNLSLAQETNAKFERCPPRMAPTSYSMPATVKKP